MWMRSKFFKPGLFVLAACVTFFLSIALYAVTAHAQSDKPKVSEQPLTAEQLAIYREILKDWMNDGKHPVHLAIFTTPLENDAENCDKKIVLEKVDPNLIHRFRTEDLPSLGLKNIGLVDPDAQNKEVRENDPGKAISQGKSVDEAVKNGFAHGLVTLSEIRFDPKHEHAIVWYGFRCGGLCGNGGTVILDKKDGKWFQRRPCSIWMSEERAPSPYFSNSIQIKSMEHGNQRL
jgi:hypothetical protein